MAERPHPYPYHHPHAPCTCTHTAGLPLHFLPPVSMYPHAHARAHTHRTLRRRSRLQVCLFAFDCLYLDGRPLLGEPLSERRRALQAAVRGDPGVLQLAEAKVGVLLWWAPGVCGFFLCVVVVCARARTHTSV